MKQLLQVYCDHINMSWLLLYFQQWKLAAEVHENHGELEKALHCWCTALKLSCAEGKEVSLYGNCLVSSGCKLIHPPESFYKQG